MFVPYLLSASLERFSRTFSKSNFGPRVSRRSLRVRVYAIRLAGLLYLAEFGLANPRNCSGYTNERMASDEFIALFAVGDERCRTARIGLARNEGSVNNRESAGGS